MIARLDGVASVRSQCVSDWIRSVLLAALLLASMPASAQEDSKDIPVVTQTVAIRDARIIQAPGRVVERGTVVMHDGLITAVGPNAAIPYDAEIIDGDSLWVYAGFVDGLSHVGVAASDDEDDDESEDEDVNRADPPNALSGLQPERAAREMLDPEEKSVDPLRKQGFTTAHVVPRGRMLPGSGSIAILTGDEADDMVLRPGVSIFMQFEGGRGVYPATPMGVMASLRQLVREADRRKRWALLYAENPEGMDRPAYDPVYEAFYPVLSHEKPIYLFAEGDDSALEVHRALQLRDELGFSIALAGLGQGYLLADVLASDRVPLFLTLALPEKEDTTKQSAADTTKAVTLQTPASFFVSDFRTHSYEDVAREKENLEARQTLERERYYSTAAAFHEAGLRFGFTSIGARPESIRKNIKRMIDAGLPEEKALAALTIDGARLLGLERSMGTVEVGKMANLVVTKGSYFDPKNPVRFVFVDGAKYAYEEETPEPRVAVAGTWNLTLDLSEGPVEITLTLREEEGTLAGEAASVALGGALTVRDLKLEGNDLAFTVDTSRYGVVTVIATVSGNEISGNAEVEGQGSVEVKGSQPE